MPYSRLFLQRPLLTLQPNQIEAGYDYFESALSTTPLGVTFAVPENRVLQGRGGRPRGARGEPLRARRRLDEDVVVGRTSRQATRSEAIHAAQVEGDAPLYDPDLPVLAPVPISVGGRRHTGKRATPPARSSSSSSRGSQPRSDVWAQQQYEPTQSAGMADWPREEQYQPTESAGRTEWRYQQQHPDQHYAGKEDDMELRIQAVVRRELREMEHRLEQSLASRMKGWIKDAVRETIDALRCQSDKTPPAVSPTRRSPEAAPSHPRPVHSSPPRHAGEDFGPSSSQTVPPVMDPQESEVPMTDAAAMAEGIMAQAEVPKFKFSFKFTFKFNTCNLILLLNFILLLTSIF